MFGDKNEKQGNYTRRIHKGSDKFVVVFSQSTSFTQLFLEKSETFDL